MAKRERSKIKRQCDLELITRLYCMGKTQAEIAEEIGLSRQQVGYDLKEIQKRWATAEVENIGAKKGEQLAKIDAIEAEAWDTWHESRKNSDFEHPADARLLKLILSCVERRCKILGVDAPAKTEDVNDTAWLRAIIENDTPNAIIEKVKEHDFQITENTANDFNSLMSGRVLNRNYGEKAQTN